MSESVCQDLFPKGSRPYQKKDGFSMDETLKMQIDILLKNIKNDWDFTIIISGGGEVRVGKSVLAMQIGAYWNYMIKKIYNLEAPFDVNNNFVFNGKELIKKGNYLGQNFSFPVLIYDEAGADLEGRKVMSTMTKDVLDFYRECGQYNLLNILVLPDFFDLPKGIALSRSIFLIDVYYGSNKEQYFERGYFNFYSRRNKKWLYLKGKKDLNYQAQNYNFHGKFYNFYPIDENEYRRLKQEALSKRESHKREKFLIQRDAAWWLLCGDGLTCECGKEVKLTQTQLGIRMEQLTGIFVPHNTISDAIRHFKLEDEKDYDKSN